MNMRPSWAHDQPSDAPDEAVQTAHAIYQDHLDAVSEAIWNRDFDAVLGLMHYPHHRSIGPRVVVIDDPAVLAGQAAAFRDSLEGLRATGYVRVCREADFDGPDRIVGRHETFIVRGGTYQVDPYRAKLTLIRRDGLWLTSDCHVPDLPPAVKNYPLARQPYPDRRDSMTGLKP